MNTIKPDIYIANDSGEYWIASPNQKKAFRKFPIDKYTGMGSSYWYTNSYAEEKILGINYYYKMILNADFNIFLKTSDGVYRHIFELKKPPII